MKTLKSQIFLAMVSILLAQGLTSPVEGNVSNFSTVGASGPFLFTIPETEQTNLRVSFGSIVRESRIAVNVDTASLSSAGQILLPLLDGTVYAAIRDDVYGLEIHRDNKLTWRGTIRGRREWSVTISMVDDQIAALLYTPSGALMITPSRDGHLLKELSPGRFFSCAKPSRTDSLTDDLARDSHVVNLPVTDAQTLAPDDSSQFIDVLVLYTPALRNALGGVTQTEAFVGLAISGTNGAYANSGISTRLRLARTQAVTYTESGSLETDLVWLKDPNNTPVTSPRNIYKADLVSLLVNHSTDGTGGVAYRMTEVRYDFEDFAFSVVRREDAVESMAFAHEVGHNQGCGHNPEDAGSGPFAYPFSFGHYVPGSFRTIMSYDRCPSSSLCSIVPYFSNPNVMYDGHPTGIANARDNRRVINNTAFTVANLMDATDCPSRVGANRVGNELTTFQSAYNSGGGTSGLGCATASVQTNGFTSFVGTVGHYQSFANGEINYHTNNSRSGQAYAIVNPLRTKWASFPFNSNHPLGYPIGFVSSPSGSCFGTQNRYQSFEGGSLVQHLGGAFNGQVFEVHGAIHRRWELGGFAVCPLGLPISDEATAQPSGASGSTGKLNAFEGGQIYWKTNAAEAYEVHGEIRNTYVALGGSASWLGFPVSNEYTSNGRARSDFEGGYITTLDGANYQAFPYSGCPSNATVSPSNAAVGSQVTISGNTFGGISAVRFANNVNASFSINGPTQITASVPSGAVSGPITLIKANCPNIQTNHFTVGTSPSPTIQLSSATYNANENGGNATITVTRSGGTGTVGVNYSTSNGTATAGSDYTSASGTLTFLTGDTSETFVIPITNDSSAESNETVNISLTSPNGGAILGTPSSAVLTIVDNDAACTYTANPSFANYPAAGGNGSFTITTGAGCPWSVTVNAPSLLESLLPDSLVAATDLFRSIAESSSSDPLAPEALFLNSSPIAINDRTANSNPPATASLYPSQINVSGMTGNITQVDVSLNSVSHSFPDDIDVVLVGPGGQRVVLMSDAGAGLDINGVNLTFNQSAGSTLPEGSQITSGTYRPSNFSGSSTLEPGGVDNFPSPGPGQSVHPSDLNIFNGTAPNGTWRLYVVDDETVDGGSIASGWALGITTAAGGTSWINFTSATSGNGTATVSYSVSPNTGTNLRFAPIRMNGQDAHTVAQDGTGSGCTASPIALGQNINGSLSTSDCIISGKYYDAYQFTGSAGQQVAVAVNSSAFDPYVVLLNSSGAILDEDDNSGSGSNARIPGTSGYFTLPANGTYTIRATSALAGATGSYSVSLPYCFFDLSSDDNLVSPGTGSTNFFMDAPSGCAWSASSDATSWLTTTSSGSGDGTIRYDYISNPTTSSRVGRVTAGGQIHVVTQIGLGGAGQLQFASPTFTVNETASTITVTARRTGGVGVATVLYATSDGTATADSDYVPASGTLLWGENSTNASFTISILNDAFFEGNETINVTLTNPSPSATLGSPTWAPVTIVDNDSRRGSFDFDGDGKSDVGIFRPSVGEWWIYQSGDGQVRALQFGASNDKIAPADFTGDGKTDVAFWRPATGEWFVIRSDDNTFYSGPFGTSGDIPVPADYDADGKADVAVFRPSTGFWFVQRSSDGITTSQLFGTNGDHPIAADYDGDGRADVAIYRPSVGEWWLSRTTAGVIAYGFGNSSDKIVPGDYTGDGKADVAFWRPATGEWFILRSEDTSYYSAPFGIGPDVPVPGDYDGDGKFDVAVFRPSIGTWYVNRTSGGGTSQQFGANGDRPIPNAFVP